MTADQFYALAEETQFLALHTMAEDERRALSRDLFDSGRSAAFDRALRAIEVMHESVRPGHPYWAERLLLEDHWRKQREHRASAQHLHAIGKKP